MQRSLITRLILSLALVLAARVSAAEWYGWTTVQGSNESIAGGVDASWRRGADNFSEKGMVFYRVRNRFGERISIGVSVVCQDADGRQVTDTYSAILDPGQVDESEGNWVVGAQVVSYRVTSFSFPDRAVQDQQEQERLQQLQRQRAQADALRQQQVRQQQDRFRQQQDQFRQQQLERQQEQQAANEAWRREHDEKVRAAQERIEAVTSAANQRANAINSVADQLVAMIQQREQEREAQRELEELEDQQREHQEEQDRAEEQLAQKQRELDEFHDRTVAKLEQNRASGYANATPMPVAPPPPEPAKPLFQSLGSFFGSWNSPDPAPAGDPPSEFASLFSSDKPADSTAWLNSKKARDIAIGLFESARDGATGIDPFKYTVRQWVLETFRRLTDSAASEALTGTSLEGKSEAYRREKAVWDAAFMRVAKPLSLGAFLKQIEAYDKLFDLWEGK